MADLANLEAGALAALQACTDEASLRAWKTRYLGDKGEIKQAMKALKDMPPAERPAYGKEVNRIQQSLTEAYEQKLAQIQEQTLQASLTSDALDVTLPGRAVPRGRLHVATKVLREIYAIFADLGFQIYRSPEVETDKKNFELLNMP